MEKTRGTNFTGLFLELFELKITPFIVFRF
jgi:hypothetical protein